jgi:CheY-like chemotaxis protein
MVPPRPTVLVVDDDDDLRESLGEGLMEEGFAVHLAADGQQAVEWLHEAADAPCVILLDLWMPTMDGREFLRLRDTDPKLLRVPVLVHTAESNCRDLAQRHRRVAVLSKPVSLEGLLAAVGACGRPAVAVH